MQWKKKKEGNENPENYYFIKETIKKNGKKERLLKTGYLLGAGILFGLAAAAAFTLAAPQFLQINEENAEKTQKVQIPVDSPQEQEETEENVQVQEQEKPEAASSAQTEKNALEQYESAYQEILTIAEKPQKALVTVYGESEDENLLDKTRLTYGLASGIIYMENENEYYILTETRAVENAETLWVTFQDGKTVKGNPRKSDPRTGLAVMTVEKEKIPQDTRAGLYVASLGNSYSLFRGKGVIALGNPSAYSDLVSYGVITSVANEYQSIDARYNLLMTDILGEEQSSGVLLNNQGEIIGLIVQPQEGQNASSSMVKALAVCQLKPLLEILSNGETIMYLGIKGEEVDESSQSRGIPQGIYVDSVERDSPAMKAGVQSGDIICSLNGEPVATMQEYSTYLQKCKEGQKIKVVLKRRGTENYEKREYTMIVEGI